MSLCDFFFAKFGPMLMKYSLKRLAFSLGLEISLPSFMKLPGNSDIDLFLLIILFISLQVSLKFLLVSFNLQKGSSLNYFESVSIILAFHFLYFSCFF